MKELKYPDEYDFILTLQKDASEDMILKFTGAFIDVTIDGETNRYRDIINIRDSGSICIKGLNIKSFTVMGNSVTAIHVEKNDLQTDTYGAFFLLNNLVDFSRSHGTFANITTPAVIASGCPNLSEKSIQVIKSIEDYNVCKSDKYRVIDAGYIRDTTGTPLEEVINLDSKYFKELLDYVKKTVVVTYNNEDMEIHLITMDANNYNISTTSLMESILSGFSKGNSLEKTLSIFNTDECCITL